MWTFLLNNLPKIYVAINFALIWTSHIKRARVSDIRKERKCVIMTWVSTDKDVFKPLLLL